VAAAHGRAKSEALRRTFSVVPVVVFAALLGANLARLPDYLDPESPIEGSAGQGNSVSKSWTPGHLQARFESVGTWLREHTQPDAVILCNQAPILSYPRGRTANTYRFLREPHLNPRTAAEFVVFDGSLPPRIYKETQERAIRSWTVQPGRVPVVAVRATPREK
jgi:hypothetical protein